MKQWFPLFFSSFESSFTPSLLTDHHIPSLRDFKIFTFFKFLFHSLQFSQGLDTVHEC